MHCSMQATSLLFNFQQRSSKEVFGLALWRPNRQGTAVQHFAAKILMERSASQTAQAFVPGTSRSCKTHFLQLEALFASITNICSPVKYRVHSSQCEFFVRFVANHRIRDFMFAINARHMRSRTTENHQRRTPSYKRQLEDERKVLCQFARASLPSHPNVP